MNFDLPRSTAYLYLVPERMHAIVNWNRILRNLASDNAVIIGLIHAKRQPVLHLLSTERIQHPVQTKFLSQSHFSHSPASKGCSLHAPYV